MSLVTSKGEKINHIKKLWENNSSDATFNSQQITLNDNIENYNYYTIIYTDLNHERVLSTGLIPINFKASLLDISSGVPNFRNITSIGNNKIDFDDCKFYSSYNDGNTTNYNHSCIPKIIYGYKL